MKKLSYMQFKKRLESGDRAKRFQWKDGDLVVKRADRADRFRWKDGDLVVNRKGRKRVDEKETGFYHDPKQEPEDWHDDHSNGDFRDKDRNEDVVKPSFKEHADNLQKHDPEAVGSIRSYKANAHADINGQLRKHKGETSKVSDMWSNHQHIRNLDRTMGKTKEDMHVYRGVEPNSMNYKDLNPGDEVTDHGYMSTSLNHRTAHTFGKAWNYGPDGKPQKTHIWKIHVPKGTEAHHFDAHENDNPHEHEVVLHRGTTLKVHHHSEDANHHYVHASVVSQSRKPMPEESVRSRLGIDSENHEKPKFKFRFGGSSKTTEDEMT